MSGIGIRTNAKPKVDADLETTLVQASELGLDDGDLETLALVTTWMSIHHGHVNADRLVRLVTARHSPRVRAYWSAVARWLTKDRRLARLAHGYRRAPIDLLPVGNEVQLARRGEDERFVGSKLRVPSGVLRSRAVDVLSPEALIRCHAGYRNRVLLGPTWRADVWTVLEQAPDLSIAEVARRALCSFATAWQAAQDFKLLRQADLGS